MIQNSRLRQAANRVAMDLRLAQSEGLKKQQDVVVAFDTGTNGYKIAGLSDPDHSGMPYTVQLDEYGPRVELLLVYFNGTESVTFNRYGSPSNRGIITIANATDQIIVAVENGTGAITLLNTMKRGALPGHPLIPSGIPSPGFR
jgi:hypothetical protein